VASSQERTGGLTGERESFDATAVFTDCGRLFSLGLGSARQVWLGGRYTAGEDGEKIDERVDMWPHRQ
jgi:hypothetical protein